MADRAVRIGRTREKGGNVAQPLLSPQAKPGVRYISHNTVLLFGIVLLELLILHLFDDH